MDYTSKTIDILKSTTCWYLSYIVHIISIGIVLDRAMIQVLMKNKVTCPILTGKTFWILISIDELCMQRPNGAHWFIFPLLCLDFQAVCKAVYIFFCPALPLAILCSWGSSSGGDTQLCSRMAGQPIKPRWWAGIWEKRFLKLVSDVELLRQSRTSPLRWEFHSYPYFSKSCHWRNLCTKILKT